MFTWLTNFTEYNNKYFWVGLGIGLTIALLWYLALSTVWSVFQHKLAKKTMKKAPEFVQGHQAYDYDILNDYKQTDNQIDLFGEIQKAWDKLVNGKSYSSIFDNMKPSEDFILAFFPCTYFSHQNEAVFKGHRGNEIHNSSEDDIKYIINREYRRARYFELFLKFCYVVQELKIPTIIENPYGPNGHNYLNLYSPYRPMYVDMNRSLFGDDKIKPTMFFAINYPMKEQFVWYTQSLTPTRPVENLTQRKRSEIRPEYADNFIKRFLGGVK